MAVARQLLAAVLALLIANPVCCCTIGNVLGQKAGTAGDLAPTYSCCSQKKSGPAEEQAPQSPGDSPSCPCALDSLMVLEAKLAQPEPVASFDFDLNFPLAGEIKPRRLLERPGVVQRFDLPPPAATWRLHCRYLL